MRNGSTAARGLFVIGFAGALLTSIGCGGSGDGGTMAPTISCTDGGPAATNDVTMNCGAVMASTTERVDFVIGGPATGTTTLRGLNFDVIYDATKIEFVNDGIYSSPIFDPSALVIVALAGGQQGHIVVGIQQVFGKPDVVVAPGQQIALSLSFRTVAGATFPPTPLTFDRAEATSASATVAFTDGLALGYPK